MPESYRTRITRWGFDFLPDAEVGAITSALTSGPPTERVYCVELVDGEGVPHASIEKTVYIRRQEEKERRTSLGHAGGGAQRP